MATRRDAGGFNAPPVNHDDGYEVLGEDDLLDEGDLVLEEGEDDGGFDEEATNVYRVEDHGPLASDGVLASSEATPFDDDERTTIRDIAEIEAEERTTIRPPLSAAHQGVADVAPARRADPLEAQPTVVTDPASFRDAGGRAPLTSGPVIAVPAPRPQRSSGSGAAQFAIVALLVVALVALVYMAMMLRTQPPAPEPVAVAPTTSLAVFSSPRGAAVLVDGQRLAQVTPTTLRDLEVGATYAITLELDGYVTANDVVTPATADPMQREYQLEPITGSLVVASVPSGAEITLDARAVGSAPTRAEALDRSRSYVLTAHLEGYEDESRIVRWGEGAAAEQTVTMHMRPTELPSPDPDAGAVADAPATEAVEAPVAANTTRRAEPRQEPAAQPSAARPSERPSTTPATPSSDTSRDRPSQRPSERVQEAPAEPVVTGTGTLSVQAVPYGQVWIDGAMVSAETPLLNYALSAGVHQIKVYFVPMSQFSEERAIRVEPGSARTVTFRAAR